MAQMVGTPFYPPSHGSYPAVQYIRGAGGGGGGQAASPYPSTVPENKGRDGSAGGASGGGTSFYWTGLTLGKVVK